MKIILNEIDNTGDKFLKWEKDNFNPNSTGNDNVILDEAFRIALYSYIGNVFYNGFGLHTKQIPDLPDGQCGRLLYCSGFKSRAIDHGGEMEITVGNDTNKIYELLVMK